MIGMKKSESKNDSPYFGHQNVLNKCNFIKISSYQMCCRFDNKSSGSELCILHLRSSKISDLFEASLSLCCDTGYEVVIRILPGATTQP